MAKIAIIPPNLPFFFDFSCQTQDYIEEVFVSQWKDEQISNDNFFIFL
jgi:hypothetical protein